MAHLLLESLEGVLEVEVLLVNEAGATAVDPLDIEDQPLLWGVTRQDHSLAFCEDGLREVLQEWCLKEVANSLALFWRKTEQTYQLATLDDSEWACAIKERHGGSWDVFGVRKRSALASPAAPLEEGPAVRIPRRTPRELSVQAPHGTSAPIPVVDACRVCCLAICAGALRAAETVAVWRGCVKRFADRKLVGSAR